eukprot:16450205-Heterocapsa_arctica.AAC.1
MATFLTQQARTSATRLWRFVTYNVQRAGGGTRVRDLMTDLPADVLALQSTGIKMQELGQRHEVEMQRIQGYHLFQWPWSKKGVYSNMACG